MGSLAVRLAVLLVVQDRLVPLFDESGYFARAKAFAVVLEHLVRWEPPPATATAAAYGQGIWPPLHPLSIGLALAAFGASVTVARIAVVLISALSTPLVYLLALRTVSRPGALFAALIHLVHPSFVAFSHLLWSESSYIFWLLLAVLSAFSTGGAQSDRARWGWSVFSGFFLGLTALTRAAAMPFLALVPGWIVVVNRRVRTAPLVAAATLVMALLVVSPWVRTLQVREGRLVALSTAAGYNLVLGNNPWPGDSGRQLRRRIREYARERELQIDEAARTLATAEIRRDKRAFLWRCLEKGRNLWIADEFVVRHTLLAVYPPLAGPLVWVLLTSLVGALLVVTGLIGYGLLGLPLNGRRCLLLIMVVGGAIPPMLTVSSSRMGLPLLVLLLPFAGEGVVRLRGMTKSRHLIVGLLLLITAASAVSLPRKTTLTPTASSYYRDTLRVLDRVLGTRTPIADCLRLRIEPGAGKVDLRLEGAYRFRRNGEQLWTLEPRSRPHRIDVVAREPTRGLRLLLRAGAAEVVVEPIRRSNWQSWESTPVAGVSVRWCGAVR